MIFYSEENKQLYTLVNDFCKQNVLPYATEYNEKETRDILSLLSKEGYFSLLISEEYGGLNLNISECYMVIKAFSDYNPQIGYLVASINFGVTYPLYLYGTDEQKELLLKSYSQEGKIGLMAFNEPNGVIEATIRKIDGGYKLNGVKSMITDACFADYGLVFARHEESEEFDFVIVDLKTEGVNITSGEKTMGFSAVSIGDFFFEDVFVKEENLLGKQGSGFEILMRSMMYVRLGNAFSAQAIAEMAVAETIRYAKVRKIDSEYMINVQAIKQRLAKHKMDLSVTELAIMNMITDFQEMENSLDLTSSLKYVTTEKGIEICNSCMQLFGGAGYLKDSVINRLYCDARLLSIIGGTSEFLLETKGSYLDV